jgi:hypothetical protein
MPRPPKIISASDPAFLAAALEGLQLQKARIEEQISAVKSLLGRGGARKADAAPAAAVALVAAAPKRGRNMSAAARRRIALAQKKRWAEYRKKKTAEAKAS